MKLKGQKVVVIGAGVSGIAAARLALSKEAEVTLLDTGSHDKLMTRSATLRTEGINVITGDKALEAETDGFALGIISPGIDPSWPLAARYMDKVKVISELEFAFLYLPKRTKAVAITGTNGKTTTTGLIATTLNASGISCSPCGNYGTPLSSLVDSRQVPNVVAIEVSSFQLEKIETFRADISIWLNFAEDHLDRHPDMKSYKAAKDRIFENLTKDDLAIVRSKEDVPKHDAKTISFTAQPRAKADYTLKGTEIFHKSKMVCDILDSPLRGRHNAENVMATIAAVTELGATAADVQEALPNFRAPLHRCELIDTADDGTEFINDSKSTNIHSLESALNAFDIPIALIVGGKDKGLDYKKVASVVKKKTCAVVTIGEIGKDLAKLFKGTHVDTMDKAVDTATSLLRKLSPTSTGMVLLSPGTSSFDQYSSYADRGDAFRHAVGNLIHKESPDPILP
ncbi:UDP-N-acetylmuramoyl-L-alanine--D-glutamate ligase [Verrucomicrobiales bacterium]|nr:UDP-N-acetylmuramoyl-L-alanine--D-glutamate ligase [Verrucomicrobiales bacterium]